MHRLLVALPVDGGDRGRALQLEVAVLEVLLAHLEAEAEGGRLQTLVFGDDLRRGGKKKGKYSNSKFTFVVLFRKFQENQFSLQIY